MQNYQKPLDKIISGLEKCEKRPTLLLHACCAPCSSYVLEYLSKYFDMTIFYYNPNIYPKSEYERRLSELQDFLPRFPPAIKNNVRLVVENYDENDFYDAIEITEHPEYADEKEKGTRCKLCYEFRLKKAFEYAKKNDFDWFCTTLSISPFKDAEKINKIGESLIASRATTTTSGATVTTKPRFLLSDFKKRNGFKRSLELSEEYSLYRQQYCGCVYSKKV